MKSSTARRTESEISAIMKKVRSRDTKPEVVFRKALWAEGLRYRLCASDLPGKPDIVAPSKRLAVFVDGDYWHGGQWRRRNLACLEEQFTKTGQARNYWLNKIRRNMERDCSATAALISDGWTVLRFWESDIRNNLDECVNMTLKAADRKPGPSPLAILPQKTFAEFFAGIGLVRVALERQGWSVAYANDLDPKKKEMYEGHFQDTEPHFHLADIHEIPADRVPTVSLATASFPCNDLSLAGSRAGLGGKQSSAFWGFIRIIEEMGPRRPPLILLENVPGFLTSRQGRDFEEALLALNRLGYSVDAFILDAAWFVPQSRRRLFVIGVSDAELESADGATAADFRDDAVRPAQLIDFVRERPDIRRRIRPMPKPPAGGMRLEDILDDLPEDAEEWWDETRTDYLIDQMSPRHRKPFDEMISRSTWSYGTVFRRVRNGVSTAELRTDGIAGCLRTPRGGSGRQILVKAGHGKSFARLLTPRECARLMGADDYNLSVPLNQALFGFGDAVCVPVVEWIAQYYLNPLVNELLRGRALAIGPDTR